jgi:hypothetical protein
VDNQQLRLAQGIDGNWYGYFGDSTDVGTVDDVSSDELDFGSDGATLTGTPAKTVAAFEIFKGIPSNGGVIDNPPQLSNWNASGNAKCTACGQINVASNEWPFIQTFDFTQGDFDVKLEQAGADEVVTLDHNNADLDDYSSLTLDRNSATQGAEVMLFIVDNQLNIDFVIVGNKCKSNSFKYKQSN